MSELPNRVTGQASDILAQASAVANSPEMVRLNIVTSLIGMSRSFWRGTDEEIFAAAGYRDANEYWHVAVSEPMKATEFAHLPAQHLLDPTEQINPFDPRTMVRIRIDSSLRLALKTGESWFIKDPLPSEGGTGDLQALMLHPRAAAIWLLSRPKRRDLVPSGLKAFLERSERPGERDQQTRRWRAERIKRLTEAQRHKREWINFAEIAEWCSKEDRSINAAARFFSFGTIASCSHASTCILRVQSPE
jgi:hypothetical protein